MVIVMKSLNSVSVKSISVLAVISLFLSSILTYYVCPENDASLKWEDEIICVYEPENAGSYVSYPRMLELSDSTLVCAYDTDSKICCVKSNDSGLTWEKEQTLIAEVDGLSCANAALIELDSGEILCAYRANGTVDGCFYTSIRVNSSLDGGNTWSFHSTVAEEVQKDNSFFGLWEPHFGFIGDTLAVFYSNDSQNAVNSPEHQNIEFKLWKDGKWGEKKIASNGDVTGSRDGMPVWFQTSGGEYVLAIEATTLKENDILPRVHIIEMLKSKNGFDWSRGKAIYITPAGSSAEYAGAPYILELPDGRLALSYQTDKNADFEGNSAWICNVITTKRAYNRRLSLTSFTKPFEPFGNKHASIWNGMLVCGEKLLVFTTYCDESGTSILLRRADV